jgi:hypothetical protein
VDRIPMRIVNRCKRPTTLPTPTSTKLLQIAHARAIRMKFKAPGARVAPRADGHRVPLLGLKAQRAQRMHPRGPSVNVVIFAGEPHRIGAASPSCSTPGANARPFSPTLLAAKKSLRCGTTAYRPVVAVHASLPSMVENLIASPAVGLRLRN